MPVQHPQKCPIARSHDLLGERWTLLVLRELWAGPRRFTDLQTELVGISPTVLTRRLRLLTDAGLIAREAGARPGAGTAYRLTDEGQTLEPLLIATARWGWRLMQRPPEGGHRPRLLLALTVAAHFRLDDVLSPVVHEWRDERITFRLSATRRGLEMFVDEAEAPTATITVPETALLATAEGRTTLREAILDETIRVEPSYEAGTVADTYPGEN